MLKTVKAQTQLFGALTFEIRQRTCLRLYLDYMSLHTISFSDFNRASMMVDLTILVIPVSEEPLVRKY